VEATSFSFGPIPFPVASAYLFDQSINVSDQTTGREDGRADENVASMP
jgi:hypothetical protein